MKDENNCLLEILFDKKQFSSESLKQKLGSLLQENLENILEFRIIDSSNKTLKLVLRGSIQPIDECHDLINSKILIESKLSCIRITDDAGDIIRERAYPILSQIEQRFRQFINQAILNVEDLDFEWWETIADSTLQNKVESIRSKTSGVFLHPLECTFFEDLLEIIESKVSKISECKPLYVPDLIDLLSRCKSIKNLKTELQKSIEKISYWDRIFSRYFQDEKEWENLKKKLKFVINERNKVMHHRPIRLGVINSLSDSKDDICAILDKVKTELTKEEISETKQDIADLKKAVDNSEFHSLAWENFILKDEFMEELDDLSKSDQKKVYERLNYLDYLASNNLLFTSHNFRKLHNFKHLSTNNVYLFKVGRIIRIICQINSKNDYQAPITLMGIFKHGSSSSERNLANIIENLEN